jgi:DNA-binding NtrC family response regulator/Tfp pilus assembly protein PilF
VAAYLGLAQVAWKQADYNLQQHNARFAFRIARKADAVIGQANSLQVLGLGHFNLGRFRTAVQCYNASLHLLRTTDDPRLACHIFNRLGLAMMSMGDLTNAERLFRRAVSGDKSGRIRAIVLNNLGCVSESLGDYGDALRYYRSAGETAREMGNRYHVALATLNRAGVLLQLNAIPHAAELVHEAVRMAVELGDRMLQGYLTVFLGRIHRRRKELEDAASYLEEAACLATRIGHLEIRLLAELERSRLLLDRGQSADAAAMAEAVWKESSGQALREVAAHAGVLAAEIHLRLGSLREAGAFLEHVWRILSETAYAEVEWRAHRCAGLLAEREGRTEDAAAQYRAGAGILDWIAAKIDDEDLRGRYLSEPSRLELRVKAARALRTEERPSSPASPAPPRVLEAITEMGRALVGLTTQAEVSRVLLGTALDLTGADRGVVLLRDASGLEHVAGRMQTDDHPWPHDSPWSRRILRRAWSGEAFVASAGPGRDADPLASVRHLGILSALAIPIPGAGQTQGVLYLDARATGAFDSAHLGALAAVAAQAAPVLASGSTEAGESMAPLPTGTVERFGEMIAAGPAMRAAFDRLRRAARSRVSILIEGESGAGKELAARALHDASPRGAGPFVAVDCGALPESLAEVELFGCRRGAFSGAGESRPGLLEAADGGTLFLDEIGNLPLSVQAKLLRTLQAGEVRPLGGTATRRVDLRVVTATNSDLVAEVRAGRFRRDLYYRIAGIVVQLPALRDRREDVPHLAAVLLADIAAKEGQRPFEVTRAAMGVLDRHDWPGNVRELRNVLAGAAALADGAAIHERDLPRELRRVPPSPAERAGGRDRLQSELASLRVALQQTNGDKSAAARLLGWSRMRIYRVLQRAETRCLVEGERA